MYRRDRWIEPEVLDEQTPEGGAASVADLVRINRFLGGHRVLRESLTRCGLHRDDAFTLLDVGAASGDAARLVAELYPRARVTSLDYRAHHMRDNPSPQRIVGDAFRLPFAPRSFDVVYCGLFLHHFDNDAVVRLLSAFGSLARRHVIANDLERHILPYYFLPATRWLLGWDPITLHDGPVSVQAAFTQAELGDLARAAGLQAPHVELYRPAFRLGLTAGPGPEPSS